MAEWLNLFCITQNVEWGPVGKSYKETQFNSIYGILKEPELAKRRG